MAMATKVPVGDDRRPLYHRVEAFVRQQIERGEWQPGHRLDSSDLARRTRISRPVVQQALQSLASQGLLVRRPRSGTYVADTTGAPMPAQPTAGRSSSIALIVPHVRIPECARLAEGVAEAARIRGLDLLIVGTSNQVERYEQSIRRHLQTPAFGIIIVPPFGQGLPLGLLHEIEASKVPTACCYRRIGDGNWPLVVEDGEHAGQMVAQHFLQTGRRRLCFVGEDSTEASPRYDSTCMGFLRGAMAHVGEIKEVKDLRVRVLINPAGWGKNEELMPTLIEFLKANPQLDGFFCQSDFLADAVFHAINDLGRSIPQDVAVVGNGDFLEYASHARQELTTVAYSYTQIGEYLVNQVFSAHEGNTPPSPSTLLVRGELHIRNSSAPVAR